MNECEVDGCERAARRNRMCNAHDLRKRRGADLSAPIRATVRRADKPDACTLNGCDGAYYGKGMCSLHYFRAYEGRDLHAPRRYGPRVPGASHRTTKAGYRQVWVPEHPAAGDKGYVNEHRLVVEDELGRYLLPGENVHHRNGVRDDNDPANLELWATCQPAGQRPDDLVAHARRLLARYGDGDERQRYAEHFG